MKSIKILPPMYLLISIIIMALLHIILPVAIMVATPWNLVGIVLLILGLIINVNADNAFRFAGTTVRPFDESTFLVTNGLYRISRNPMYLGFVLILTGVAVLIGSLTPFTIIALFIIFIDRGFIHAEEQMLTEKFGKVYQEYKTGTRRWI